MAIKDALLPEFDHEVGTTRKLLERVPDGQLGWKPHDKSMSLGRLATHLAGIAGWTSTILSERSFDLAGVSPGPRARNVASGYPGALRRLRATRTGDDGQERRRVPGDVVAQARRPGSVLSATRRRVSQFRNEPPHSPPRPAQRLPAAAGHSGAVDLRPIIRRRLEGCPGFRRSSSGWKDSGNDCRLAPCDAPGDAPSSRPRSSLCWSFRAASRPTSANTCSGVR